MQAAELRSTFLSYFTAKGHVLVPSASLIPHDSSLLFNVAGMVPFKPYFVGEEKAPFSRAVSVQKCLRVADIDIIGTTTRHLTFFEMMGNFSFGDYFKESAITFAWGLLTEGFGIDPERLWVTVHVDDDEAATLWHEAVGFPTERIQRLDSDNFWEMGPTGPCGPSSEIFFDKGPAYGADGGPAFGGDERFVEIWNLVFMQFLRDASGVLSELPKKNIDTGAGFERVLSVLNGVDSVFATDLFGPLLEAGARSVGRAYGEDDASDVAIRKIAEHGRSMTMLVADGVLPSNEGRGYVLRRVIRRAILAARRAGSEQSITSDLVAATIEKMGDAYPVLVRDREVIEAILEREEVAFARTLRTGLTLLDDESSKVLSRSSTVFPGEVAFRLHDTHGFPIELTAEIVLERGLEVDRPAFDEAMAAQRERARSAAKMKMIADDAAYRNILEATGPSEFVGRDVTRYAVEATVLAVLANEDGEAEVFLDATPFYAESGGQVGDTGSIVTESGSLTVRDTQSVAGGLVVHRGQLVGEIVDGQVALATIDAPRREAVRRNHTATHLLHAGLREVLGDHVRQQGSLVAPDRLRFDFSHGAGLQREELVAVLERVNTDVVHNDPVETVQVAKNDAEAMGAIAFFGDKYGDRVRVVRAGEHSLEFCGGTHVDRLGDLGQVQIISEASIGSNTRRIEAVSGFGAFQRTQELEGVVGAVATLLKTSTEEAVPSLERLLERFRDIEKQIGALRQAQLSAILADLDASGSSPDMVTQLNGYASDQLRQVAQELQRRGRSLVIVLGETDDGKVGIAVASDGQRDAGSVVKELAPLVGGGGGGSSTLAVAGGRDTGGLSTLLAAATAFVS